MLGSLLKHFIYITFFNITYFVNIYLNIVNYLLYSILSELIRLLNVKLYIFKVLKVKIGPKILVRVYRSY